MNAPDPLHAAESVPLGSASAWVYRVDRISGVDPARWARRPRTVRVILENVVRHFDPKRGDLRSLVALANGEPVDDRVEFLYYPERILLQDFTGIPVLVDLATLRSAAGARGLPPERVNPAVRVDLVVDHSVQVDSYGSPRSYLINLDREYERNHERYRFLQWAKGAYTNYHIVPPGNGICHQVNLEHLAEVIVRRGVEGDAVAFPDTLLGTDSHTTMVNGVSVLGWGVGGIEAEAVMLGEPVHASPPGRRRGGTDGGAARGSDGHRPRAHRHAPASRDRSGRPVRRVLRSRGHPPFRGRPRHDLEHVSRVRRDGRVLPYR